MTTLRKMRVCNEVETATASATAKIPSIFKSQEPRFKLFNPLISAAINATDLGHKLHPSTFRFCKLLLAFRPTRKSSIPSRKMLWLRSRVVKVLDAPSALATHCTPSGPIVLLVSPTTCSDGARPIPSASALVPEDPMRLRPSCSSRKRLDVGKAAPRARAPKWLMLLSMRLRISMLDLGKTSARASAPPSPSSLPLRLKCVSAFE
mmetsp:Transcript_64576/g.106978  ORF Transcript_64576/g.106978 Transcript_64576/m.106978 type:complete len:206 (+) Transcript_64576:634-1251(+)